MFIKQALICVRGSSSYSVSGLFLSLLSSPYNPHIIEKQLFAGASCPPARFTVNLCRVFVTVTAAALCRRPFRKQSPAVLVNTGGVRRDERDGRCLPTAPHSLDWRGRTICSIHFLAPHAFSKYRAWSARVMLTENQKQCCSRVP